MIGCISSIQDESEDSLYDLGVITKWLFPIHTPPMQKPIRILHFLWKGDIGGAERAVFQLIREQLKDEELSPAVAFAQSGGTYWEKINQLGCPVVPLNLPNGHTFAQLSKVASMIAPFDLHHFHSAEPLLMTASSLCKNVRRVYTHRGGLIKYGIKKRLLYHLTGFFLRSHFHGLSGNTAHGARSGAALFHLPSESFEVTYNGFDFDLLVPSRSQEDVRLDLGLNEDHFVLGTIANLKPWKRIDHIIHLLPGLDHKNIKLLIVGDGVDRRRLETLTDTLNLRSKVIFTGLQANVADYLQIMDAFCLPSMGLESFGNAMVEAMAFGLPSIVFEDGGGMVEHITHGETGFIIKNPAELKDTVSLLMSNNSFGRSIGENARIRIREKYTPANSAKAYKALYLRAMVLSTL